MLLTYSKQSTANFLIVVQNATFRALRESRFPRPSTGVIVPLRGATTMKMSVETKIMVLASAIVAALVGWGLFHRPQSTSLFNMLNAGVQRFLQWPLFTMGTVPVTPLFLIKCIVFLIALSIFSRLLRSFLGKRVLSHTHMDLGTQYAFVRATGYIVFLLGL